MGGPQRRPPQLTSTCAVLAFVAAVVITSMGGGVKVISIVIPSVSLQGSPQPTSCPPHHRGMQTVSGGVVVSVTVTEVVHSSSQLIMRPPHSRSQ